MADWTDGAPYAPRERPFGFAMPEAAPLAPTPVPPHPSDDQPPAAPGRWGAPEARPLAELVPATAAPRDPSEPFPAEQPTSGAWGSAHRHWDPTMPLAEVIEQAPAAPAAFPPPAGAPAFPPPAGVPVVPVAVPAGTDPALAALPAPSGEPVAFPPPAGAAPGTAAPVGQQPAPGQYPPPVAPVVPGPVDPYALPTSTVGQPPTAGAAPAGHPVATAPVAPAAPVALSQLPPPVAPPAAPPVVAHRPPAPATPTGHLRALVDGLGPVMLGALAFGAVVPVFSVIGYVVASWLSQRVRIGRQAVSLGYQASTLVFFVLMVGNWLVPSLPDLGAVCRWLCIAMLVVSLAAGHRELVGRRR